MIDGFTGWAEAVPIADQSAETVASAFHNRWISVFGVPEQVHTDRGVQFESAIFTHLCELHRISKTRTTGYRPQANGKIERFNRTLVTMLRKAVSGRPDDWENYLPAVLMAYRSTPTESTGFTPYYLVYGREMRLGVDYGTPFPDPPATYKNHATKLISDLESAYELARETIRNNHNKSDLLYNKRAVEKYYKPGDLVRREIRSKVPGVPTKFSAKYSGLCDVLEIRGPVIKIHDRNTNEIILVAHDAIRKSSLNDPILERKRHIQNSENSDISASKSANSGSLNSVSSNSAPIPLDFHHPDNCQLFIDNSGFENLEISSENPDLQN